MPSSENSLINSATIPCRRWPTAPNKPGRATQSDRSTDLSHQQQNACLPWFAARLQAWLHHHQPQTPAIRELRLFLIHQAMCGVSREAISCAASIPAKASALGKPSGIGIPHLHAALTDLSIKARYGFEQSAHTAGHVDDLGSPVEDAIHFRFLEPASAVGAVAHFSHRADGTGPGDHVCHALEHHHSNTTQCPAECA